MHLRKKQETQVVLAALQGSPPCRPPPVNLLGAPMRSWSRMHHCKAVPIPGLGHHQSLHTYVHPVAIC